MAKAIQFPVSAMRLSLLAMFLLSAECDAQTKFDKQQIVRVDQLPRQDGWQVEQSNPIIKAGDFIERVLWNDPHVLKDGDSYVMYLSTSSSKKPFQPPILPYRAVSTDGLQWKLDPKTPLMDASGTPFVSVETPSVVKHNGVYHLYYTGVYPQGGATTFAIGHLVRLRDLSHAGLHGQRREDRRQTQVPLCNQVLRCRYCPFRAMGVLRSCCITNLESHCCLKLANPLFSAVINQSRSLSW